MTRHSFAAILLLAILSVQSSLAGPWPRKQGSTFLQLGLSTIGYNKAYRDDSKKYSIGSDVRDNVVQLFMDYGVTDRLSVSAMIPMKFLSASGSTSGAASFSNSGISDVDLSMRYNWFRDDGLVISNEVLLGFPSGKSNDASGLLLGDGEFNVLLKILAGRSFHPAPLYLSADIGYNIRSEGSSDLAAYRGHSDDVLYNLEAGYGFLESRLYLIFLLSGKESTSKIPSQPGSAGRFGLQTNNQEYTAWIGKVLYKFDPMFGCAVSYATATHGRNIAGGAVLAGSIFVEF